MVQASALGCLPGVKSRAHWSDYILWLANPNPNPGNTGEASVSGWEEQCLKVKCTMHSAPNVSHDAL